jgi:ribose transport system substrate-binding protein
MKRYFLFVAILLTAGLAVSCNRGTSSTSSGGTPAPPSAQIVWYGMMPHPYINQVQTGAQQAAKDLGVPIDTVVGQQWSQENETQNVEALSTKGYKAFSIFPGDAAGANGLFQELTSHGLYVVAYGGEPDLPTPASFTVATDIPGAAAAACEKLIQLMGDKGNILNVLETVTDVNTKKRKDAIVAVVARHPNVKIIQEISDMTEEDVARNKIEQTLAADAGQIDGVITTGYNPTVAAAGLLSEWNKDPSHTRIHFVGIDTDSRVIDAIRDGSIDATIAQNPIGHGYISCAILNLMVNGWKPRQAYQFVDAGMVVVTKENVDTYPAEVQKITDGVMADLKTKYLTNGQ